jgi:hypothetical protein
MDDGPEAPPFMVHSRKGKRRASSDDGSRPLSVGHFSVNSTPLTHKVLRIA